MGHASLNLYQYAGNNPATYTDPFGLFADTLEYAGAAEEADVAACRAKSAKCDELFTELHESTHVFVVERLRPHEDFLDPNCLGGCTDSRIIDNRARIQYRPGDFNGLMQRLRVKFDSVITLGHEAAHAVSLTPYGTGCTDASGCAVGIENQIRSELGGSYGYRRGR